MVAGPSAPLPPPSTSHSLPAGLCSLPASWGLKWSPACWEAAGSRFTGPPRRRPRALAPLPPATPCLPQPRPPRGRDHLSVLSSRLLGYPFAPLLLPLLRHLPQALPFPASSHPSVYIVKAGRRTQTHTRPDTGAHTLTHDRQRRRRQQLGDEEAEKARWQEGAGHALWLRVLWCGKAWGTGLGSSLSTAPFPRTLRVAAVILIYKSVAKPCGPVPENSWGQRSRVSSGCRLCGCWLRLWDAWDPGSSLVLRDLPTKPLILQTGGQNREDMCPQVA